MTPTQSFGARLPGGWFQNTLRKEGGDSGHGSLAGLLGADPRAKGLNGDGRADAGAPKGDLGRRWV